MPRRLLWGLAGLALLAAMALSGTLAVLKHQRETPAVVAAPAVGGPFRMTDQEGRAFTEANLQGRPTAMFFGFTYCPEVCPTTLLDLTNWMGRMGERADRLNVVFVSIDPERDTPTQLKTYLSSFDPRIRGLSGTVEDTAAMAALYKVHYQKIPVEGGPYTMDHSSMIYLFDAQGGFVELIRYGAPDEEALEALNRLVD
jgi:protein SCO1/2